LCVFCCCWSAVSHSCLFCHEKFRKFHCLKKGRLQNGNCLLPFLGYNLFWRPENAWLFTRAVLCLHHNHNSAAICFLFAAHFNFCLISDCTQGDGISLSSSSIIFEAVQDFQCRLVYAVCNFEFIRIWIIYYFTNTYYWWYKLISLPVLALALSIPYGLHYEMKWDSVSFKCMEKYS
jgi:hypothetical protein